VERFATTVEWLDRRFAFVLDAEGSLFLRELNRLLNELASDHRISEHLASLGREAEGLAAQLRTLDERITKRAVALRNALVTLAPSCDDSKTAPPRDHVADPNWRFTLAGFDRRVEQWNPHPPFTFPHNVETKADDCLAVLKNKDQELSAAAANGTSSNKSAREWSDELAKLDSEFRRLEADFKDRRATEPGVSLVEIRNELLWVPETSAGGCT
jgi:hypothetical protein